MKIVKILWKVIVYITTFFYGFLYIARLKARYPSLNIEVPNTIRFDDINVVNIANNVSIGPYSEIVVYKYYNQSSRQGSLTIQNRVIIGKGANIRAAGGGVFIGEGTMLAQNVSLIAANHLIDRNSFYIDQMLDEKKVGVYISSNVWVGAGVIVLPGVTVGENSVLAAGAVVTKDVPPGQLWAGTPATCIRILS